MHGHSYSGMVRARYGLASPAERTKSNNIVEDLFVNENAQLDVIEMVGASQSQFDETTINSVVEKGSASKVQSIQLCSNDTPEISLDNYQIRFLKFSHLAEYRCLVFRFANLSEPQLEKLNFLTNSLPGVDQSEEQHVVRLMKDSSDSNMASGI